MLWNTIIQEINPKVITICTPEKDFTLGRKMKNISKNSKKLWFPTT